MTRKIRTVIMGATKLPNDSAASSTTWEAAHWLLKDGPYRAFTHREEGNPNKLVVEKLLESGVSVELCGLVMKQNNWSKDDLLPGVTIVSGAYQRIVDLQLRGYAYIPF